MFKNFSTPETKSLNSNGRSYVGESLQLEGDMRSSGDVDVAGLIKGNVYVSDMVVKETGSIIGYLEAKSVEINGHVEGKITADSVIIGRNAVVKGDIFFKASLKTEEGADIDGYIKRTSNGKSHSEEDIAIEEIVERTPQQKKPKSVSVIPTKEAV